MDKSISSISWTNHTQGLSQVSWRITINTNVIIQKLSWFLNFYSTLVGKILSNEENDYLHVTGVDKLQMIMCDVNVLAFTDKLIQPCSFPQLYRPFFLAS